ncbi:MAG: molybdopterin dinucleotide binding domain-containing protein [Actinomycetota bacterium]
MNSATARTAGIEDGDRVKVETFEGQAQYAVARVTNLVHPEVIATQGGGGGWGAGSSHEEVNFNALLPIDEDHIDFVSGALDSCISVRVDKVSAEEIERSRYWKRGQRRGTEAVAARPRRPRAPGSEGTPHDPLGDGHRHRPLHRLPGVHDRLQDRERDAGRRLVRAVVEYESGGVPGRMTP